MTDLPSSAEFVVIGAGIHGLSTAWHLAGARTDPDVVVLDKSGVGAGASGIACGIVRNNYFQPAMRELMAHSVGLWEQHAAALSYHGVGYLQISPERMTRDVAEIHQQQQEIGYDSAFVEGPEESDRYLRELFPDWQAQGIHSVLHEKRGGYANNLASVRGLAALATEAGARILDHVGVLGFDDDGHTVHTDRGTIRCDQLVIAVGPWIRDLWRLLDLPEAVHIPGRAELPMWRYLLLQEGTLKVDPGLLADRDGAMPPVVHVDSDAPLLDEHGDLVTDALWGIYFKPDTHFGGVQGGAAPTPVDRPLDEIAVDPYGPESPDYVVGEEFARMWPAALAHCLGRFEGTAHLLSREPSGGLGCFTPDSFPVFDRFRDTVTVIADSNHGYKMIGVGQLVARELLGAPQPLLEPFRFGRFAEGRLHPVSNSPFPWS